MLSQEPVKREDFIKDRTPYQPWDKPSRHRRTPCTASLFGGPSGHTRSRGNPGGTPSATAKRPQPPSGADESLAHPALDAQDNNRCLKTRGASAQCGLGRSRSPFISEPNRECQIQISQCNQVAGELCRSDDGHRNSKKKRCLPAPERGTCEFRVSRFHLGNSENRQARSAQDRGGSRDEL
jgi:hypothetical protein